MNHTTHTTDRRRLMRQLLALPPFAAQALLRAEARERPLIEQFLREVASMVKGKKKA